jgi:uncharacterized membrane protein YccC
MKKLLSEKKRLLQEYLQLTNQQKDAIADSDYQELLILVEKKQAIIEQVEALDAKHQPLSATEEPAKDTLGEILLIAQAAKRLEEANSEQLNKQKEKLAEMLKSARKNRKTHQTYRGKHVSSEGIILDEKK